VKIYLIGLPGSGKSTLGKQLASVLNLTFIDLDEAITARAGLTIPELFQQQGETYFRELEASLLRETSANENFVMATGGGTSCFYEGISFMNSQGVTVYLDVDVATIASRMKESEIAGRPLLNSQTVEDLIIRLKSLHDQRHVYYGQSKIRLSGNALRVEDILAALELIQSKK
jgi:shikimate kinase